MLHESYSNRMGDRKLLVLCDVVRLFALEWRELEFRTLPSSTGQLPPPSALDDKEDGDGLIVEEEKSDTAPYTSKATISK